MAEERNSVLRELEEVAVTCGAHKAQVVETSRIRFDRGLRKACEANYCGNYGRNYTCPPYIGEPDELIEKAKSYPLGLVYQTVTEIEDSYDFEGMMEAAETHSETSDSIEKEVRKYYDEYLLLTAGGCSRCKKCAVLDNQPCRMPDRAISSVEAYCMDCSQLAKISGMNYINGADTVTYFGLFLLPGEPA